MSKELGISLYEVLVALLFTMLGTQFLLKVHVHSMNRLNASMVSLDHFVKLTTVTPRELRSEQCSRSTVQEQLTISCNKQDREINRESNINFVP